MQILARIVGAIAGMAMAIPSGAYVGCGIYEAGERYAQCGYEFEGTGHVLISIGALMVILGFAGQWIAGWIWRRISSREL